MRYHGAHCYRTGRLLRCIFFPVSWEAEFLSQIVAMRARSATAGSMFTCTAFVCNTTIAGKKPGNTARKAL
jgi:hypothetical protein